MSDRAVPILGSPARAAQLLPSPGGGLVEARPQDTQGKEDLRVIPVNGTRSLFENAGFTCKRPAGTTPA
jgi:hypothetical protein